MVFSLGFSNARPPLSAAWTIEELDPGFVVKDSTEWKDCQFTGAWR